MYDYRKDSLLTKYDGQEITYDAIGNPLTYRDGMTMTWKNGRQLSTLQSGDSSISYSYDSSSVRISKTVNGVKHTYAYLNGMLMYETRGEAKFYYSYDANGTLYSVKYTLTDSSNLLTYYYTHNSRGDIVGIYNGAGQLRAHYEYDAWGNVLSVTDENGNAITSSTHIGNLNPFRYRGYYLDSETGLYYLMSRYYDPVTHRFVNADGYFQSGQDILDANMSAYCRNNPVMYFDPTGYVVKTMYEYQKDLLNPGRHNYGLKDITKLQMMGYGKDDKFILNDDGTFTHYNLYNQVVDTVGAVFCSVEVDAGVGYGLGASVNVSNVDITALVKADLISLSVSYSDGLNIGAYLYAGAGIGAGINVFELGWDDVRYQSYLDDSKSYSTYENNVPNKSEIFSADFYCIVGGNVTFSFNHDYMGKRWEEIWG